MKVVEPDDEMIIISINKKQHRVRLESETESAVTVIIEPIEQPKEAT